MLLATAPLYVIIFECSDHYSQNQAWWKAHTFYQTFKLSWKRWNVLKKKIVSKEIFLTFTKLQIFFNTIWNHSQEVREIAMKLTSTTNFLLREWKASVHSVGWRVDGEYYRNNWIVVLSLQLKTAIACAVIHNLCIRWGTTGRERTMMTTALVPMLAQCYQGWR